MSDTNTDTNTNNDAINNKKNKNTGGPNVGGFILYYTLGLLGIILWVLFGTTWLYISKLATSGIPTDTKYEPYTCDINPELGKNPDGTKITVPMNTVYELGMKGLAFWQMMSDTAINKWQQEATIETREFIDSFKDTLIEEMRDSANIKGTGPAASTGLSKFWSIILNNTAARGFRSYDMFSIKSDKISDSLKIIVYGLFGLILFPFIWLINGFCSAWYIIKAALFNENLDNMNDGGADNILDSIGSLKYLDTDEAGAFGIKNWPKSIGRGILWLIIWMFVFPVLTFFVLPVYSTFMPFFKMLFSGSYTLKVDNKFYNSNEHTDSKSFFDFVKDTFAYKRTLLLLLSVLNLFTCANTYLGQNYLGAVVIAVIFATIFGNIFVDTKPEDNTMIFQDPMVVPQKPPVRKQSHKVCMFPKDINRIDKELRKLNNNLLEQINRAKGVSMSQETQDLFNELKSMSKSINNEFTDVSLSDDKSVIDKFEKKVEQEYADTIKKFVSSLDADIAAAPPSIFSSNVRTESSSSDTGSSIAAGLIDEPETESRSRSQSIESNVSTESNVSDVSTESNVSDVSTESNVSSQNVSSQSVDPGLFYKLSDFINSRKQSKKSQMSTEDEAEIQQTLARVKAQKDAESAALRAKKTEEGANLRAEMEALLAKQKAKKEEEVSNPLMSAGVGTPGAELSPKQNISQENIIPESNVRVSSQVLKPEDIKSRTAETSRPEDITNPMLASTKIGTKIGAQGKSISPVAPSAEYLLKTKGIPTEGVVNPLQQQQQQQIQEALAKAADKKAAAEKKAATEKAISNINLPANIDLQKQALEAEVNRQGGLTQETQANLDAEQAYRKAQNDLFAQQFALANKKGGSNKNRTLKKREQNIKIRLV